MTLSVETLRSRIDKIRNDLSNFGGRRQWSLLLPEGQEEIPTFIREKIHEMDDVYVRYCPADYMPDDGHDPDEVFPWSYGHVRSGDITLVIMHDGRFLKVEKC